MPRKHSIKQSRRQTRRRIQRQRGGGEAPPPSLESIRVYYHIFCNAATADIVRDQVKSLFMSGLYERANAIRCCLAGEGPSIQATKDLLGKLGKKFEIAAELPGDKGYERPTLLKMKEEAKPGDKLLYMHTKGTSKPENEAVKWWRTWMEWFLVRGHKDCLTALDTHDTVGCSWLVGAKNTVNNTVVDVGPHFPGNFWWVRGDYLQRLPEVIGDKYNDPEDWISRPTSGAQPRVKDLDPGRVSPVNAMYRDPIWPSTYVL